MLLRALWTLMTVTVIPSMAVTCDEVIVRCSTMERR